MTNPNIPPHGVHRYRMRRQRKRGIPPDYVVPVSVWRTMNAPAIAYGERIKAFVDWVDTVPDAYRRELYERWALGYMTHPPLDRTPPRA